MALSRSVLLVSPQVRKVIIKIKQYCYGSLCVTGNDRDILRQVFPTNFLYVVSEPISRNFATRCSFIGNKRNAIRLFEAFPKRN